MVGALTLATMLGAWVPGPADAQSTRPLVRTEIAALLSRLQASGCQFNRNGKWYKGAEANAFLAQKFAMLDAHGGASSTEQFIDLAASKSGTSGQPYRVRCDPAPAVESNVWLRDQLSALRQDAIGARP